MTYRITHSARLMISVPILASCTFATWPDWEFGIVGGAAAVLYFWLLLLLFPIKVTEAGVSLYRFNWLPWADVVGAKRSSVLFLPYLVITRPRGIRWWLPLYCVADRTISEALLDTAPTGSPIHEALSGSS